MQKMQLLGEIKLNEIKTQDMPLIVQSDRSMLLDVHSPNANACRDEIIAFSELVRAPEHIHTYAISAISLWNAKSAGLDTDKIIKRLKKWSKFAIPQSVENYITDISSRFGKLFLEPLCTSKPGTSQLNTSTLGTSQQDTSPLDTSQIDTSQKQSLQEAQENSQKEDEENKYYVLTVTDPFIAKTIVNNTKLAKLLIPFEHETSNSTIDSTQPKNYVSFKINKYDRGEVKLALIKLGFPVDDKIPLVKSENVPIKMTCKLRDYQENAVKALLGDLGPGTGYGTIVMPCGSGKTVVGLKIMEALQTKTLILCPNVVAVHQWIKEIISKTNVKPEMIGEYSGEKKELRPITVCTYQVLTYRASKDGEFEHMKIIGTGNWGLVIYDEVHMLPAPVFKITAELQAIYRAGLTATLIREDGKEDDVFSLVGPKRYDIPWTDLAQKGWIASAYCVEIRIPLKEDLALPYAIANRRDKYKIASTNPSKDLVVDSLLEKHKGESIIIIGQYLDQLKKLQKRLGFPMITGSTSNTKRDELYNRFREGLDKVIIVSKVANFAIDLPDASIAIQISGTFGSRQEEAQRLGRILRPKRNPCYFYSIVSKYTVEEEFSANRQKFLVEQGYKYEVKEI